VFSSHFFRIFDLFLNAALLRFSIELNLEPDPDPLAGGMDPEIRIRTKMSRIPNTAKKAKLLFFGLPWS
jgi:hypothetical protein